jgi:hypothetical protein
MLESMLFGIRSRYQTAFLVRASLGKVLARLGKKLIGMTIFINFMYLTKAFVTTVSNSESIDGVNDDVEWRAVGSASRSCSSCRFCP